MFVDYCDSATTEQSDPVIGVAVTLRKQSAVQARHLSRVETARVQERTHSSDAFERGLVRVAGTRGYVVDLGLIFLGRWEGASLLAVQVVGLIAVETDSEVGTARVGTGPVLVAGLCGLDSEVGLAVWIH